MLPYYIPQLSDDSGPNDSDNDNDIDVDYEESTPPPKESLDFDDGADDDVTDGDLDDTAILVDQAPINQLLFRRIPFNIDDITAAKDHLRQMGRLVNTLERYIWHFYSYLNSNFLTFFFPDTDTTVLFCSSLLILIPLVVNHGSLMRLDVSLLSR